MNREFAEKASVFIAVLALLATGVVAGMYVYNMGYENGQETGATAYALEVSILNAQIVELNETNTEYYDNIGYKQQKIDELTQKTVNLEYQVSNAWDEGYSAGYASGYEEASWYDNGYGFYQSGYDDGYGVGYGEGYATAVADLTGDGYTTGLGEYTITFRDFNSSFEQFYYRSSSADSTMIRMLVGEELIHEAPFGFVGYMNTVCIIDLRDPDGNLIAVGGLFGTDLTLDMQPLIKP